jgi:hypothetical protein
VDGFLVGKYSRLRVVPLVAGKNAVSGIDDGGDLTARKQVDLSTHQHRIIKYWRRRSMASLPSTSTGIRAEMPLQAEERTSNAQ